MATYFVTHSETATWDDNKANRFKYRSQADRRVGELLAIHPVVRMIRYEHDQPVKELRFTRPGRSLSELRLGNVIYGWGTLEELRLDELFYAEKLVELLANLYGVGVAE